jgi:SsrA-binding protein
MKEIPSTGIKIISQNKRAFFDYEILERFEAGISLKGSEVKSLRVGRCSIVESYISKSSDTDELQLVNCYIPDYKQSSFFKHEEKRHRKLLLHKMQIIRIIQSISKKGTTAIPLKMYFKNGMVKIEIALAKGKTNVDKRQDIKEKDWKREQAKVIKQFNIK